jgi:hypothetical protein
MKSKKSNLFYAFVGMVFIVNCFIVYYVQYGSIDEEVFTEIELRTSHVELGESKLGKDSFANYSIKNIGQGVVIIKNVEVDCHCTVAEWDKNPVKSQDSTTIRVKYDNHLPGYYKRVITVEVNTKNSPVVLTFAGETVK